MQYHINFEVYFKSHLLGYLRIHRSGTCVFLSSEWSMMTYSTTSNKTDHVQDGVSMLHASSGLQIWEKADIHNRLNVNYHPFHSHVQPYMHYNAYESRLRLEEETRQRFDSGCFSNLASGLLVIIDRRLARTDALNPFTTSIWTDRWTWIPSLMGCGSDAARTRQGQEKSRPKCGRLLSVQSSPQGQPRKS